MRIRKNYFIVLFLITFINAGTIVSELNRYMHYNRHLSYDNQHEYNLKADELRQKIEPALSHNYLLIRTLESTQIPILKQAYESLIMELIFLEQMCPGIALRNCRPKKLFNFAKNRLEAAKIRDKKENEDLIVQSIRFDVEQMLNGLIEQEEKFAHVPKVIKEQISDKSALIQCASEMIIERATERLQRKEKEAVARNIQEFEEVILKIKSKLAKNPEDKICAMLIEVYKILIDIQKFRIISGKLESEIIKKFYEDKRHLKSDASDENISSGSSS